MSYLTLITITGETYERELTFNPGYSCIDQIIMIVIELKLSLKNLKIWLEFFEDEMIEPHFVKILLLNELQ
jgi:hypothetical protein